MTMHLGRNHEISTFRCTLGSILAEATGAADIDETRLTQWMKDHLRVVAIPFGDSDVLARLERDVTERLDPPLNLQGMQQPTPINGTEERNHESGCIQRGRKLMSSRSVRL
jgi:hypothetical protein